MPDHWLAQTMRAIQSMRSQHISMADWCLSQAIKERDGETTDAPKKAKSN